MQFLRATKSLLPVLRNCLLVACLIYIGANWIMSSGTPKLDEVVLKRSLGNGGSIYGARDGQGGATVGFSYRYYVHKDLGSDQEILTALVSAHPFLKTKEPDVQVTQADGAIRLIVRGEVYEYRSYPLEGLGAVSIDMRL
ncbi:MULTISPECIES: hypothetical protein [Pseudomonas]|jgi:hypothetical protein|uniref:Uncharacterized protein n=2 Tax=Pseudomonas TaxID=286 RepID=A0A4Y9THY2_PSEFL|nr:MULTISPECIES: hypothetical protein [Pseudomonas]CRM98420.1 hypothetical protein [Pseudomonas sp. 22 E 5]MCX9149096.1 hypothetical protein [Pseudomonas sp. TB1-B1]QXH70122.1 hypothetical protein KSS96_26865 [Pseudomonas asgharzadehiana]TFW42487.1 hypothetical protein E4T65_15735 [Pseudomonas fluorescens]TKJ62833.1 hypothetical protein PspCFBP13506_10615 [Pseudomonas sp. CFBP13506]